ncbi:glycosyltransferase family 2 protein [Thermophilibacter sp.]
MSGARPAFREAKVAFVILTWNSERVIGPCLESVLALECGHLEVWVVDNGSTDSTPRILSVLASRDPRLHVMSESENLGTTVSRNRALRLVGPDTDYVCVLDSDTVVNQAAFDEMAAALAADPSIGVVGPTMSDSSGAVQLSGRALPTLGIKIGKACPLGRAAERAAECERPHAPVVGGLQNVGYLLSACWLMPRSSLDRVGLLDEAIFYAPEDVDWCLRCHEVGLRVVHCPGAHIVHEYQRLSHKKLFSTTNLEHLKGLAHYFSKHHYLLRAPRFDGLE